MRFHLCSRNVVRASASPRKPAEKGWLWTQSGGTIRNRLKEKNFRPKKSMGQNFMEDDSVIRDIVDYSGVHGSCIVVEVGPGTGAMTKQLVKSGARVYAVEKDDRLFRYLINESQDIEDDEDLKETRGMAHAVSENLTVLHQDVLKVDLGKVARDARALYFPEDSNNESERILLMGNLPYNITRDFLMKALPMGEEYSTLLLMLQHEVAVRLIENSPGSTDWRAMNIILQYYCDAKYVFRVDRFKYTPVPKVDGALVELQLKSKSERKPVPCEKDFISLVKRGFLQKRKMLSNALRPTLEGPEIQECLKQCGLPVDARAQSLSLDEFVALSWAIHEYQKA